MPMKTLKTPRIHDSAPMDPCLRQMPSQHAGQRRWKNESLKSLRDEHNINKAHEEMQVRILAEPVCRQDEEISL